MLRYLKAVQMMKQIIEENNLTVMATIARYACAYEAIAKPEWWDKSKRYRQNCRFLMPIPLITFSVLVPSSSKAPTSVISRGTLEAKSILRLSAPIHWNGTRTPDSCQK